MAKKGNRVQVILECTEHKASGKPGTSRYITIKNKNDIFRLQNNVVDSILHEFNGIYTLPTDEIIPF